MRVFEFGVKSSAYYFIYIFFFGMNFQIKIISKYYGIQRCIIQSEPRMEEEGELGIRQTKSPEEV